MTNSTLKARLFLLAYAVAFAVCWVTQAVFWNMSGRRGSLLAFLLFRCEEFIRLSAQKLVGHDLASYPPSGHALSVVVAALLMALPIALAVCVAAESQSRAVRWVGYGALILLAFMTFYWPSIPRYLF